MGLDITPITPTHKKEKEKKRWTVNEIIKPQHWNKIVVLRLKISLYLRQHMSALRCMHKRIIEISIEKSLDSVMLHVEGSLRCLSWNLFSSQLIPCPTFWRLLLLRGLWYNMNIPMGTQMVFTAFLSERKDVKQVCRSCEAVNDFKLCQLNGCSLKYMSNGLNTVLWSLYDLQYLVYLLLASIETSYWKESKMLFFLCFLSFHWFLHLPF